MSSDIPHGFHWTRAVVAGSACLGLAACRPSVDDYAFAGGGGSTPESGGAGVSHGGGSGNGGADGSASGGQSGGPAAGGSPEYGDAGGSGPLALSIAGGYATSGPFNGYAYTFVTLSGTAGARPVTIYPSCDQTTCVPEYEGNSICASGVVGSSPDFASAAYAGFDLNQSRDSQVLGSVVLEGSLVLAFSNTGGSELRVQLGTPDGKTYCHELRGVQSPAVLPLGEFNESCWEDQTTAFFPVGTAVNALQLYVPGQDNADTPFDFCLLGVATE
jgi:hypothetical protein